MNKLLLKKFAQRAGFCFWENESHAGTRRGEIDWSCEYDREIDEFANCIIDHCASLCEDWKTPEEIKKDIYSLKRNHSDFDTNLSEIRKIVEKISARLDDIEKQCKY